MGRQMVVFKLLNEDMAIEVSLVESIIKYQTITKIPHAPGHVIGITNLRGNIVPVIDLKTRLGISQSERDDDTRIIVASVQESKVGMVVDAVTQVVDIEENQVEATPQINSSIDTEYIKGIVKIEESLVLLLDLEKVLFELSNEVVKK
jgi:purine-binding chemotaxis protein CheW